VIVTPYETFRDNPAIMVSATPGILDRSGNALQTGPSATSAAPTGDLAASHTYNLYWNQYGNVLDINGIFSAAAVQASPLPPP
jgi:hypothetical protein